MSSWLTGIATKATSILESVDEYAASSIQSIVTTATGNTGEDEDETKKRDPPVSSGAWSYPSPLDLGERSNSEPLNLQIPPSPPIPENKTGINDESLLQFLNDPKASTPLTDIPLSSPQQDVPQLQLPPDIVKTALHSQELPLYSDPGPDALAAENEALRSAVSACRAEQQLMQEHWDQSQREVSAQAREISHLRRQLTEGGGREARLKQELATRGGKLEAQGVQIEVMRRELEKSQALFQEKEASSDRDKQPSPPGVVSELKVELATLQTQLESAQSTQVQENTALQQRIEQLLREESRLTECASVAEQRREELENRCEHLQDQLGGVQKELSEYKQKASAVLQNKEKLIQGLQERISTEPTAHKGTSEEEQRQKLKRLQDKCDSLSGEMRTMGEHNAEKLSELNARLEEAEQEKSLLSSQLSLSLARGEERESGLRELGRQAESFKSQFASKQGELTARDITIRELEGQLARAVSHADPSSQELQGRVRSLTDTVIQKQRSIEALGAENTTLKLQVDKLNQRLSQSDSLLSEPSGKTKLRHIASLPLPQACPPRLGRNFESVVTRLDLASLRAGVFFRQYPYARLCSILYLAAIHLCFLYFLL